MTRLQARARLFAILLAGLAGFVDAVGFIRTGGFFVSFMSGNSTRLGIGIAISLEQARIAGGIIVAFLAGVVAGSLVGEKAEERRPIFVLLLVAVLLAASAALEASSTVSIALIAAAMGAENAVFGRGGEVRLGVTYMTGSLVRVGSGIAAALAGRPGNGWGGYLLLWLAFVAGAASGAAASAEMMNVVLWGASAFALFLALASVLIAGGASAKPDNESILLESLPLMEDARPVAEPACRSSATVEVGA